MFYFRESCNKWISMCGRGCHYEHQWLPRLITLNTLLQANRPTNLTATLEKFSHIIK
jgi:hypothetical protein